MPDLMAIFRREPPKRGRRMQGGMISQISCFISQMMQDRAIVTMEGQQKTAPKLSNGTGLNDLE